ncbi:hypothetical protein MSMTP_2396 [Methanosarcina sp. MTP4]|uniref:hypothetical protein n=1 Tax=Methanosarcina sp. MTP4 TaxID=1434100 RepID=UPI000615A37D|nr:hypothetical protein [Methanosarcina sp. MTP4]AKB25865.1 hypothetical protein MSMTP_2396 [Methanosarcina sp. MTP4]
MTEIDEISCIFQRMLEDRYKGLALDDLALELDEIVSNNISNSDYRSLIIEKMSNVANKDIDFYVRLMNWTIENSTICLSYLFMKTTMKLIVKNYAGRVDELNSVWMRLFYNCVWIIVNNRLIEEVDLSTPTGNIVVGKDLKSIVSITFIENYDVDILDLLEEKYTKLLIESEYEPDDIGSIISKLNRVYQHYTDFKIKDVVQMVYSNDNVERYLPYKTNLKPNNYDELLFEKYGYLFFPLITDVTIKDGKISFVNDGYGSLSNCNLFINYNDKCLFNKEVEIENYKTYHIYIEDDLEKEIQNISSNDKIDFYFIFKKFGGTYKFIVSKDIWILKEGLSKKEDINVTYIGNNYGHVGNNYGNNSFVSNSTGTTIQLNSEHKNELIITLSKVIENVDDLDVETSEKVKIKNTIKRALDELEKVNSDISLVKNFIQESGILLQNVSKIPMLFGAVNYIKTQLGL